MRGKVKMSGEGKRERRREINEKPNYSWHLTY